MAASRKLEGKKTDLLVLLFAVVIERVVCLGFIVVVVSFRSDSGLRTEHAFKQTSDHVVAGEADMGVDSGVE